MARQSLILNCASLTLAMSWTRSSVLREKESAPGCAVKASMDSSNVGDLCWGCQGHQWVCGTHESSSHLLLTGCSRPLHETEENRKNRAASPTRRKGEMGKRKGLKSTGNTDNLQEIMREQRKTWEGQKGRVILHSGLHEDNLEKIQRTCGRPLQDQCMRGEYEAEKHKGQSHKTKQSSERNEAQVICSGILLLCREGGHILETLESSRSV